MALEGKRATEVPSNGELEAHINWPPYHSNRSILQQGEKP
jgi:hypothetical protein